MKFSVVFLTVALAAQLDAKTMTELGAHSYTNRLIHEKSPYLLQHAHNPVDWYPWGDEAFEAAEKEDKPIFLSIGYATCHWCHVMEHESFENEVIAELMNEAFICIKVDREERPDIDNIYMTVCQMMSGQGGWPLTIIMTPDRKPFHAATYIPPEQRFGRMGLKQLIPRITHAWMHQRPKVLESSGQVTDVLIKQQSEGAGADLDPQLLEATYSELMGLYDSEYGGFGMQPKFPTPHRMQFLLRQGNAEGIAAVEHTLKEMRNGGIFDHVGYGFHRYSTDRRWLLPHFEKMLYDQALLVLAYTEAYERTENPLYKQVVEEVLTYVMRDMTDPSGGFYSAEDADSEGEEGLFYIWSAAELKAILGDDYEFAAKLWNIEVSGNFKDESTGLKSGKNIPHYKGVGPALRAGSSDGGPPHSGGLTDTDRINTIRQKLFKVREKRIHPLKDTKVLADWNGLMIAAFAKAGRVFGNQDYIDAAARAVSFVECDMTLENGELWHRWREGYTAVPGHLEDYAFMMQGLLELYESTFELNYLNTALHYNDMLTKSFIDEQGGGYFMTADDAEALIVRPKELYDGAIPSGNSVQFQNLLKLARLTGRTELEEQAAKTARAFGGKVERSPSNFAQAMMGLQFAQSEGVEIVVVGKQDDPATQQMIEYIHSVYKSDMVVLFKDNANSAALAEVAPFTKDQEMVGGKPTVYICRNFACEQPVTSLDELKERFFNH